MARLKNLKSRLAEQPSRMAVVNTGSWRAGMNSSQRGYGYRWQQARDRYLRDHPLCVYCERKGLVSAANVVDHIREHQGDPDLFWDQSNWQPLCTPCHSSTKQREEAAARMS